MTRKCNTTAAIFGEIYLRSGFVQLIYLSYLMYELYCRPTLEGDRWALTLDIVYTTIVLESFNCSNLSLPFLWCLVALASLYGEKKKHDSNSVL